MLYRGATVKIECSGIPEDVQEIKWFKDGTPIKTSSSEVGILKVANLDPINDGKYRCEITQSSGTKISSNEVDIAIKKRPNLKLITPPECMLCRGATVKIKCSGIPKDVQEIKWFKDGTPIKTSSSEVGILKVANLDPTNDGKYRCEITQSSGTKISSREVDIAIKDEQAITLSTLGDLQIEGAELEIKCKSSIPTPTEVCWYKENKEIIDKGRFLNGTCQDPSLTISTLTLSDSGAYRCKITSHFGFAEGTIDIDVKEQSIFVKEVVNLVMEGTEYFFPSREISKFLPKIINGVHQLLSSTQRKCILSITNNGCRKLSNPNISIIQGREHHPLASIAGGKAGIFIFTTEKTSDFSTLLGAGGHWKTKGVLTFDVEKTDQQIAILWNVAQKSRNRFAIQIRSQDSETADQPLYEHMLQQAASAGTRIEKEGTGYKVSATMSNEITAHLQITIN
ncbi:contactin-4-like [Ostrea edulis]|uniref:contactin-4-like n=1 Tax=Ostrea edulis TaxID=37623 RepID=UPI0024AF8029|nr:contactin-4-like [Ostrea edulis]